MTYANYDTPEKIEKRRQEVIIKPLIEKAKPLNWAWHKLEAIGYDGDRSERDYDRDETKPQYYGEVDMEAELSLTE